MGFDGPLGLLAVLRGPADAGRRRVLKAVFLADALNVRADLFRACVHHVGQGIEFVDQRDQIRRGGGGPGDKDESDFVFLQSHRARFTLDAGVQGVTEGFQLAFGFLWRAVRGHECRTHGEQG